MTEPNLDTLLEDFDVWCRCESRDCQRSINYEQSKQAIADLIANQVREARIDELRLIEQAQQDEDKWSLFCMDDTSDFGNYIAGRIKELGE